MRISYWIVIFSHLIKIGAATLVTLNINKSPDAKISQIEGIIKESPREIILESLKSSMVICNCVGGKIRISNEEATLNLIKALQKAIELNWFK